MWLLYIKVSYIISKPRVVKEDAGVTYNTCVLYRGIVYIIRPPWRKDCMHKILYATVNKYFTRMWNMYKGIIYNTTPLIEKEFAGVK